MKRPVILGLTALILGTAWAGGAHAQSQWTDLDCGLAGSTGVPQLTGSGDLSPGSSNSVQLAGAAASAPSLLFLALEENATAFKGGVLKPLPNIPLPVTSTSPGGASSLPFVWPTGLPESLPFFLQYAVLDGGAPQGVALSNALRGVSSGSVPVLDSVDPLSAGAGDSLTIAGVNLPSDPLDVLTQLVLPGDVLVGSMTADSSDGNAVTARIDFFDGQASMAQVAVGSGEGQLIVPASLPGGTTLPEGGVQLWSGDPADIQVTDAFVSLNSDPGGSGLDCSDYAGTITSQQWMEIEIPELICTPGTQVNFMLWAYTSSGLLCKLFKVVLHDVNGGTAVDCASLIANMISESFWNGFNMVVLPQVLVDGNDAVLRIPPPLGDSWIVGSSKTFLKVCVPPSPGGCVVTLGGPNFGLDLDVVVPEVIPDNASAQLEMAGTTLQGGSWSATVNVSVSGATTDDVLAGVLATALQNELASVGFTGSVTLSVISNVVRVVVDAPGAQVWSTGNLRLEVCP